jgi:hypothetical protein
MAQENLQSRVVRREDAARKDPGRTDNYAPFTGGVVTAVRKNAADETVGYAVSVLDDTGASTAHSYPSLSTWPGGATFEVGDEVRLTWPRRDGLPMIDATAAGDGAAGPTTTALTGMLGFITRATRSG